MRGSTLKTSSLLGQYAQLDEVVKQMLVDAQQGNWESLISWQVKYHQLAEDIRLTDDITTDIDDISLPQHDTIQMYINNILTYQQQLQQLIRTRHVELSKVIGEQVDYQTKIASYHELANLI